MPSGIPNSAVSSLLEEMGILLELAGENHFRIRAYQKAAQVVEGLTKELKNIPPEELLSVPGIGSKIAAHIRTALETGTFPELEALKKKFPPGLLDIVKVQGIGPKRARFLFDHLGIDSVDKLKAAARRGKIRTLEGFGEKTEQNILAGLSLAQEEGTGRMLYWEARLLAEDIASEVRKLGGGRVVCAGSLRRGKETVGDIDILCQHGAGGDIISRFIKLPQVESVISAGAAKASVRLKAKIQCDLRVIPGESFGAALQYFTGSKEHNVALRELALSRGYSLSEYGLFKSGDKDKKKPAASGTEEEIYSRLGLEFIPPELREGRGEIEAAAGNRLPVLVEEKDIRGDVHNHTRLTDGADSIEEMARAAAAMGWEWAALGDHSRALGVAHGLSYEAFRKSREEMLSVQNRFPDIRLIRSIEMEILKDGRMDFADGELRDVGLVIGAVHSSFRMSEADMTQRILKAVRNPWVDVIAHLSGRLIGKREAYHYNADTLFEEAAATRTAFEINGQPDRQDMTDISARRARELNVPVVLSSDAHSAGQFRYMAQAVIVARRAWLEKKDILNCLSYKDFTGWLADRKKRAARSQVTGHRD